MGGDPQGHAISLYKENMIIYIFTVITVIFMVVIIIIIIIITVITAFLKQSCCTVLFYILLFIKLSKILTKFEVNSLHAKKRNLLMTIKISEVTLGFTSFHN